MNIVNNILMESFDLDPYYSSGMMDDPRACFNCDEYVTEANQLFTELTNGTNKGNVLQKLVRFIVKGFQLMWKLAMKLWNWIKRLFTGKVKRSMDDIVEDSGIEPGSNNPSNPIPPAAAPKSNSTPITPSGSAVTSAGKSARISIPIEADPMSEMKVDQSMELAYRPLKVSFDAAKRSIRVTPREWKREATKNYDGQIKEIKYGIRNRYFDKYKVKGKDFAGPDPDSDEITEIFDMIVNPKLQDTMSKLAGFIADLPKYWKSFITVWEDFLHELNNQSPNRISNGMEINYEQINKFQLLMNDIWKKLEPLMDTELVIEANTTYNTRELLYAVNGFAGYCSKFQMALNSLTALMRDVYTIDASYIGSVNNIEQLSKFSELCIKGGIPPKYIGYNVYALLSPEMNTVGGQSKPIWGQSRLVIFPKGRDVVNKIALSGWGIQSNLCELNITKKFDEIHESEILARTLSITANRCVTTTERVKGIDNVSLANVIAYRLKSEAYDICKNHKLQIDLHDIHYQNVAYKGSKPCIMDYGWALRNNPIVRW